MKMKKFLSILTLATAAFAAPGLAHGDGDIVDIRVMDMTGRRFGDRANASGEKCSPSNPVVAGEEVCVRVRMLVRNAEDVEKSHGAIAPHTWRIADTSGGAVLPAEGPSLGLMIGETVRWASFSETGVEAWQFSGMPLDHKDDGTASDEFTYFTDFYFKYRVQPGDMGLPVKLIDTSLKPVEVTGETIPSTDYAFMYVNVGLQKYVLTSDSGNANLLRRSALVTVAWPGDTYPLADYNLAKECLYVKTIDFDNNMAIQDEGIWREVNKAGVKGNDATVVVSAGATVEELTTVYIWSEKEEIIVPLEGLDGTQIQTVRVGDVDKQVLTVQIKAKASEARFRLKATATATVGTDVKIYMSPVLGSIYSDVGGLQNAAVTRTVRVGEDSPPGVCLRLDGKTTCDVTADADYKVYKAKLSVRIENDDTARAKSVVVGLNASVSGDDELSTLTKLYNKTYLRITQGEGFPSIDGAEGKTLQVTVPAGQSSVDCYVYVLGASDLTEEKGIRFEPTVVSGDIGLDAQPVATLYVRRQGDEGIKIEKTSPASTVETPGLISMAKADKKAMTVWFNDTYRNMFVDKAYTFYLVGTGDNDGIIFAEVSDGKYKTGNPTGNYQFNLRLTDEAKENKTYSTVLYGLSPDGSTTERRPFTLSVIDGKSTYIKPVGETLEVGEGDILQVKLGLNQEADDKKYIFILGATAKDDALFDSNQKTQGAPLGDDNMTVTGAKNVKLLDGNESGTEVNLKAVLSDTIDDPTDETTGWNKGTLAVTVTNKPPVVLSLSIGGIPLTVASDYGTVLDDTFPMTIEKEFKLVTINEVEADRSSLSVRWSIDGEEYERENTTLDGCTVWHAFASKTPEGKKGQLVQVYLKDKDMLDYPAEPNFRCWVKVTGKPYISISTSAIGGVLPETDANVSSISLALSEPASEQLTVMLKVQHPDSGYLKLREVPGSVQYLDLVDGYDRWLVTFKSGVEKAIMIADMDGTDDTLAGLDIAAEVAAPLSLLTYYEAGSLVPPLRVQNVPPEVIRPTEAEEAYTNMNASAGTPYTITYGAKDVAADLKAGIAVEVSVDGSSAHKDTLYDNKTKECSVTFDGTGAHVVEVTFTDKDQMTSRRTLYFYVGQSKQLELRAHGPGTKVGSSGGYSSKYQGAKGLGAGRVYAGENGPRQVVKFVHKYSFGLTMASVPAVAYGYKADGRDDDGTLTSGDDQPIDKNGNWSRGKAITEYYNYTNDDYTPDTKHKGAQGLDSFVYGWACNNAVSSKNSDSGTEEFAIDMGETGAMTIPLPDVENNGSSDNNNQTQLSIPIQYWEAIFSSELLKSDNCGDINGDGIPDYFVRLYKFDVLDDSGKLTGDDLRDLNYTTDESPVPYCAEGDYLPTTKRSMYASLIPDLPETWQTIGNEFTPVLKIRGFPEQDIPNTGKAKVSALNDAARLSGIDEVKVERHYTNPKTDADSTLSYVEWLAWQEYAAANPGAKESDWTPENPTNPMRADTDGDGMTDGYEYWIWYRAHVGWVENYGTKNETHKRLVGRRYDPKYPGEGTRIPSETLAAYFNPNVSAGDLTRDIDNDGLPDVLEFMLGTSPYDFDTDGDGLPDGWEICYAGTDPLTVKTFLDNTEDTKRNDDGDAMAIGSWRLEEKVEPKQLNTTHARRWTFAVVVDGDTEHPQWYAMKVRPKIVEDVSYGAGDWTCVTAAEEDYVYPGASMDGLVVDGRLATDVTVFRLEEVAAEDIEKFIAEDEEDEEEEEDPPAPVKVLGYPVILPAGTPVETVPGDAKVASYKAEAVKADRANACWIYGKGPGSDGELPETAADYGCLALGRPLAVPEAAIVAFPRNDRDVAFLHYLCYQEFGFDPRTAWRAKSPLAARWDKSTQSDEVLDSNMGGFTGTPTRTRDFAMYDEFLLYSFFVNNGTALSGNTYHVDPNKGLTDVVTEWGGFTTNPQGPTTASRTDDEYFVGRTSESGADTDGDGVPDGWELYVMAGPKDADGNYVFAPAYAGFTAGGETLEKSYFSPFVDEADKATTALKSCNDGLNELREFAGTDSVAHYADYSTTIVRPAADANWLNKFFPTDPWNADTDGDGISDGNEGKKGSNGFVYGSPVDSGKLWSIPGGGLNPCSVDTDRDGLPDPWELQFKGTEGSLYAGSDAQYSGGDAGDGNPLEGLTDGMDGTVWDAYTYPSGTKVNHNGVKVTEHVNRDYDRDGLENWQEYLTGTMRCWRYDDPVTSMTYFPEDLYFTTDEDGNRKFDVTHAVKTLMEQGLLESGSEEEAVGEFWYKTLVDASSELYNPHFITGTSAGSQYFSKVVNGWDTAYDDIDLSGHPSGTYYWFCNKIDGEHLVSVWGQRYAAIGLLPCAPYKYACCSPIDADSDRDGLDDYYEVFHGMNPLLGEDGSATSWVSVNTSGAHPNSLAGLDLVYDSLGGATGCPQAWAGVGNYWYKLVNSEGYTGKKPRGSGYDFEIFPWLNGLADADPDGDAMRNQEEGIMGSLAPITAFHHSDPTPLWMTDSSYSNSLVRMFYRMPVRSTEIPLEGTIVNEMGETVPGFSYKGANYSFCDCPGFVQEEGWAFLGAFRIDQWAVCGGENNMNFIASFEENEGFDTDHDGLNDDDEVAGKYRGKTDPLDADSPRRRQAMYFQGPERPSILQTMPTVPEEHPLSGYTYPDDLSFLHYTVECWVKPESLADATVIERTSWVSDSNPADQEWIRCNFQLGIKSGKWYTKFDPNDTTKNTVSAFSDIGASTEWTHLAATYDGTVLVLYVNGEKHGQQQSGLQPAYGASAARVAGLGGYTRSKDQSLAGKSDYRLNAIILGASVKTCKDGATGGFALDLQQAKGWSAYTRFFKGYIDEVRIWDGARSVSEIAGDMKTRYTAELVAKNRSDFFEKWSLGGASDQYRGRYAKDANGKAYDLPAELRYHWAFDSVFGAVDEARVAKVPSGFDFAGTPETTARARLSRPEGYEIAWWTKILTGYTDTVYNSPAWVEWIPSTVAHLPRFDGTTLDSAYWSEDFKGDEQGTYSFARTAEPVSNWQQLQCLPRTGAINGANYTTTSARHWLARYVDATNKTSFALLYEFAGRHRNQVGDDLLPLGGAFVKMSETLWDDQGATSNWEINGGSADSADGIPSWWASYANDMYYDGDEEITWETVVTWPDKLTGLEMTAGEAYLRDLARGYVSNEAGDYAVTDGSAGTFVQTYDMDSSGIPDWWEELYGLVGVDALADSDNDGLPNYVEYLLSEVFEFQGVTFDPTNPRSADPYISDYFFKIGDLYAGEIFTDHDLVDDAWEDIYDETFATRLLWDAYADSDGDGWSNRSENRYAKQCMPTQADKQTHYSAADGLVADYPIPTLELTLNYNEALPDSVRTAPIVVQVTRNPLETADPDATFSIGEVADAQAGSGTSDKKTTDKTEASYTRTLGKWSNRHVVGTLTPGYLNKNAIALQFCFDPSSLVYTWEVQFDNGHSYSVKRGTRTEYDADRRKYGDWNVSLLSTDTQYAELEGMDLRTDENSSMATWVHSSGVQLGTIDLTTGAFDLDLGVFKGKLVVNSTNTSDYVSLEDQTFRIVYSVNPAVDLPRKLYLGEATTGHIREGKNQVIAFFDLDKNGYYTPGEPYGVANDVDISWKGAKTTIEVCESSPVTPRVNLWGKSAEGGSSSGGSSGGASGKTADRVRTVADVYQEILDDLAALHLTDKAYSNALMRLSWMETNPIETPTVDQSEDVRVRVVRWLVDGTPVWRCGVEPRVILDKKFRYREGEALTEASILADGSLDLDWEYLQSEVVNNMGVKVEGLPVSKVDYLIVIGDGVTSWSGASDSNNVVKALSQVITRYYGTTRKTPVVYSPSAERDQTVRSANPTFKWKVDEEPLYGYTAFKVQVYDQKGATVFDSGVQPVPARDANGCYVWTAPLFVGDKTLQGKVYANESDYSWKVSMYNAKYRTDSFSAGGTYKQATQVEGFGYGTANVAVKYFGPAASYAGKTIRVRAYTSPDFTGTPIAAGYVAAPDDPVFGVEVAGRAIEKNCDLVGLPNGTYYLQAFIDSNNNGVCDPWESMGYLCDRTGATADWLNPVGLTFEKARGVGDLAIIYLEDADTDGDALPDAWEYAKYGSLTAKGAAAATLTAAGEALVSKELESDLLKKAKAGSASSGLAGHLLTSFNSSRTLAALVSGVDPTTLDPDITFTISDFAFDATAGEVTLKVAAEVASMGGSFENDMFTVRSGDTLSFQVYQAPAPVGPWTAVGAVQSVKVTAGAVGADGLLRVKPEGVNAEGGFYTVRLVK